MAKWWAEIGLAISNIRESGISYTLSGALLEDIQKNSSCETCDIDISITAENTYATPRFWEQRACGTWYEVPWSYIQIFPFFSDAKRGGSLYDLLDQQEKTISLIGQRNNVKIQRTDSIDPLDEVIVWLFVIDGGQVYSDAIFFKKYTRAYDHTLLQTFFSDYQNFINNSAQADSSIMQVRDLSMKHYIIVANADSDPLNLCLIWEADAYTPAVQLPTDAVYITSQGKAGNATVGLQATLQKSLPQYLVQSYVSF